MKVVIDTNVVASAMFFGGRPKELLELLVSHKLEAYACTSIKGNNQRRICIRPFIIIRSLPH